MNEVSHGDTLAAYLTALVVSGRMGSFVLLDMLFIGITDFLTIVDVMSITQEFCAVINYTKAFIFLKKMLNILDITQYLSLILLDFSNFNGKEKSLSQT